MFIKYFVYFRTRKNNAHKDKRNKLKTLNIN